MVDVVMSTITSTLQLIQSVPLAPIALAIGLYALSIVVTGLRWQLVLRAMGVPSRLLHTSLGHLGSIFVNNVTPASRVGGEAYRTAYIHAKTGVTVKQAAASIAFDRGVDLLAFGLVFLLALPTVWPLLDHADNVMVALGIGAVVVLTVVLVYRLMPRVRTAVSKVKDYFVSTEIDRRSLALALIPAVIGWAMDVLRVMIVASAVGVHLDIRQAAALSVLATLGGLVPTVGGIGAVEGGLTAGLVLFGVPLETALAVTLLERSISLVLSTLAGALAALGHGGGRLWQFVRSPSSVTGSIPG